MLKKVLKLKKFGIFRDFSWDSGTPDFARFNLIYGWNKSGKTTFSRVFAACEKKVTKFKQYPEDGEFEITTGGGSSISHSNCQDGTRQIKVFNKDFIEDNVSFDPTNPSKPIVYISEKDIEKNKKLKALQNKIIFLAQQYELAQKDRQKNEKAEDDFRKSTARTVKDIVGNLKINDKYRDYDKSSIKTTIEAIGINKFSKLSIEDFEKKKKLINGEQLSSQNLLPKYGFSLSHNEESIQGFSGIFDKLIKLLQQKVVAETIDRFKDDPELNKWAQHGFEIHKTKHEKKKCLFCQNGFSAGFLDSLSKHFNADYQKLQKDINSFIKSLGNIKKGEIPEKNQELYGDLQNKYKEESRELNKIAKRLNSWIDEVIKRLEKKHANPLSEISAPKSPENFISLYDAKIKKLNAVLIEHNTRVNNYEKEMSRDKEEIEKHLIAVAIEEQDYLRTKSDYDKSIEVENEAKKAVDENNREASKLEKEASSIGKAIPKINKHLEEFFGRKEILLELDDSKKGYIIKREGDIAYNLSEGEKNAIAFSYFIAKTQERSFKVKEGIIVIDDPVSSFDSNFIYHCFSLIKNHFREVKQLIICTHNFEFFNLVKDWLEQKNRKVESRNKKISKETNKKPCPCEFFMIENIIKIEKRCASIVPLEETLRKFKSEYHFLFSRLNQFIVGGTPDYADFYTIGNIARRFLEIYTNFKIPTIGDLKSKVDQLDTKKVTDTEKDKVYKLIQEFSHGLDPTSTIEHKDKSEIRTAINVLMKIIEESDEKHFKSLKSNL
jgi:wobble nucleotide-excising tRNase